MSRLPLWLRTGTVLVVALVAAMLLWPRGETAAVSTSGHDLRSGLPYVARSVLPVQARETLARIAQGGPFPYDRDGIVFDNRERLLPVENRGYYREYTVPTPGSPDRGARRIVTGDGGERYWTGDHYVSFARIRR